MCALKVKRIVVVTSMGGEKRPISKLKFLAHKILHQFMATKFKRYGHGMEKTQDLEEIAQNEANERLQQEAENINIKKCPLNPIHLDNMGILCVETVAGCFYWDLKKQLVDEDLHVKTKTSNRSSSNELSSYVHS